MKIQQLFIMSEELNTYQSLKKVLNNSELTAAVVRAVVNDKPQGWSARSQAPYFKREYALRLKAVLDGMIEDRKDVLYEYSYWREKFRMSPTTLYTMINQSRLYLLERMDTEDRHYARIFSMVEIKRKHGVGVVIRFNQSSVAMMVEDFKPRTIEPESNAPVWREKIDRFLEESQPGEQLNIVRLALTPDEIRSVKVMLAQVTDVMASVTCGHIKLIKTTGEQL